jgi:hypothetical protein
MYSRWTITATVLKRAVTLVESWAADAALAEQLLAHFRETYDRYCYLTDDVRGTLAELSELLPIVDGDWPTL